MTQVKRLFRMAAAFCLVSAITAKSDTASEFGKHKSKILSDSSLIRYYTFEEGKGEEVRNHVQIDPGKLALSGGPIGSLYILRASPYGIGRQGYMDKPCSVPSPEWTTGRWPWKSALTSGLQRRCIFRSGVVGENFEQFTLEAWVRTHEGTGGGSMFAIAHGYKSGLLVTYSTGGAGIVNFRVGVPEGGVIAVAKPFKPGVWHHLVCSSNGKELKIHVDGELRGQKPLTGPYTPPEGQRDNRTRKPFMEGRGTYLQIGGTPFTRSGNGRFDIGEFAIYESELSADKVQDHYQSGKPAGTDEEQLAQFHETRAKHDRAEKIRVSVPKETWGYFPMGCDVPLDVAFPAGSGLQGRFLVKCRLTDLNGTEVWKEEKDVNVQEGAPSELRVNVPAETAGIFFLDVVVLDAAGEIVKVLQEPYCLGFTVPIEKNEISPLNPLGIQACLNPWMARAMPLNRQFVHSAKPKSIAHYKEEAKRVMADGPQFPPMMYCLSFSHDHYKKVGPDEEKEIREYVTTVVRELKDTAYCWEVMNEPNGKFLPETYMKILTICSEIIRAETPDKTIVAPGASPSGIPFIKRILQMGAAELIDVVSFHNYTGTPVADRQWKKTAEKLKALVVEHAGSKELPIWNSESGIFPLPRVGERPMTYDHARRAGYRSSSSSRKRFFVTSMATFPEEAAAAIQVQAILMDFAAGYRKYIKCQGPSLPGLEGTNTMGLPTLQGIALTALSSVVNTMVEVELLPLSSVDDACAIVTNKDGKRTAVAFSDGTPTLSFKMTSRKTYRGMDMLGNPLTWEASASGLILVELGENPVYIFDVPETMQQISPLKVSSLGELTDKKAASGALTVTNPFDAAMEATLSVLPPKGATVTLGKSGVRLAPGQSLDVPFSLNATKLRRRQYELKFELKSGQRLLAAASTMFDSPGSLTGIPESSKPIALDGNEAEWAGIPADAAQDEECVVHGKPNLAELWLPQWRGNDDLSFSVQSTWRKNDAVYLLIKVKDNVPMPAPKDKESLAFQWDCLELFFDSRPYGKRGGPVSIGADQAIVIPKTGSEAEECVVWYAQKDKATIDAQFVGRKTADGYLLEGKITPKAGNNFKLLAGSQFCMDLLFDDVDDPAKLRKAAMTLHGIFNNSTDSDNWGRYQLDPAEK